MNFGKMRNRISVYVLDSVQGKFGHTENFVKLCDVWAEFIPAGSSEIMAGGTKISDCKGKLIVRQNAIFSQFLKNSTFLRIDFRNERYSVAAIEQDNCNESLIIYVSGSTKNGK